MLYATIDDVLIIAIIEKKGAAYQVFRHLMKNSDFLNIW
ncbi:hypothetical protein THERMOT_1425 [Bathymodiolus thermophilus thioautotrophic gill symbiont]|nr:hypothetical protein THERMOT_1425 [Bathymodiolus thermophilus thioautotrophic gill symbiont]